MTTATKEDLDLAPIRRRALAARLGTLKEAARAYAEDVPALIAALDEHRRAASRAARHIAIERRLSLK